MSMTDYEDRFKDLNRYAPPEGQSEKALARKFLNGLLPKISRVVITLSLSMVAQIYEAVRGIKYQDERHPMEPKRAKD